MFKRIPDWIIISLAIIMVGSWFIMLGFNLVMAGKAMMKPNICEPAIVKEAKDPYQGVTAEELVRGDAEVK